MTDTLSNRLGASASRYLRQHAEDPVAWQPWSEEALALAARLGRLLLVSIGYSACHWCHVMAHETFADPEVAQLLNAHFVPIKVDREEHPDVDARYMGALLAQQGSGGWPITAIALADGSPIWCATYLPPRPKAGMPGLGEVLEAVLALKRSDPGQLEEIAAEFRAGLALELPPPPSERPSGASLLARATEDLAHRFDPEFAGFGRAPKFPQPYLLDICLRSRAVVPGGEEMATKVLATLEAMARGGIHDHLEGGFFRYSTDRFWMVPHFEKMLYDQAGLLELYAKAGAAFEREDLLEIARRIDAFVAATLTLATGLLASSTDADSGGEEGAYYLMSARELAEVLGPRYESFADFYGVTAGGNFEGRNILHRSPEGPILAPSELAEAIALVVEARRQRGGLGIDDKAILDQNAQYATARVRAAGLLGDDALLQSGLALADRVREAFALPGGGYAHVVYASGTVGEAYAADWLRYSEMALAAWSATGEHAWLEGASRSFDRLVAGFLDTEHMAIAIGDPRHPMPSYDRFDGATASTLSLAIWQAVRLATVLDRPELAKLAESLLEAHLGLVAEVPSSFPVLCWAAFEHDAGTTELVIPGREPQLLARALRATSATLIVAPGTASPLARGLAPGHAYVCHRRACELPLAHPDELSARLALIP